MVFTNTLGLSHHHGTRMKWKAIVMVIMIVATLTNITANGTAFAHIHHHSDFQDDSKSSLDKRGNQLLCYIVGIYYCIALLHSN
jgi:hypothetical protein